MKFIKPVLVVVAFSLAIVTLSAQGLIRRGSGGGGLFADGTAGAPSMAFASEPTLGFYRSGASTITMPTGTFLANGSIRAGGGFSIYWSGRTIMQAPVDGHFTLTDQGQAFGARLKTDALPVAGTCGTSPAVLAGSTAFAGAVNVGTGGTATSCTVTFGGTAFPAAPFCQATVATATPANARAMGATATTTVLTLTASTAWAASDVVNWICVSRF